MDPNVWEHWPWTKQAVLASLSQNTFVVDENLHNPLCEDHSTQGAGRPDGVLPPDKVKEFAW